MGKRSISPSDSELPPKKRQNNSPDPNPLPIPDISTATPWSSSEISSQLPPLPEISDPDIERAVFTHRGLDKSCNYERFEWLGDAYLETIATVLIFETFPQTSAGRSSQLREQLVRNSTLADYFQQYGLGKRARLPGDLTHLVQDKQKGREALKIKGDIFEAFVAGVILSDRVNGVRTVTTWLRALWGRTIREKIKKEETRIAATSSGADESAVNQKEGVVKVDKPKELSLKEQLANLLMAPGVRLRYEDMPNNNKCDRDSGLPLFTVGVRLEGWGEKDKLLGHGTALGKKEAGQKAAKVAMENKKLMKLYSEKKRAFLEQKAQQAAYGADEN